MLDWAIDNLQPQPTPPEVPGRGWLVALETETAYTQVGGSPVGRISDTPSMKQCLVLPREAGQSRRQVLWLLGQAPHLHSHLPLGEGPTLFCVAHWG